jgi:hypothetical protein
LVWPIEPGIASLNALEFTRGVTDAYELAAGVAMGVILPALVFLTFRSPPSWPTCDPPSLTWSGSCRSAQREA